MSSVLIVRDAQRETLIEVRLDRLRAWLRPHLREHFAGRLAGKDDDELGALIDASVTRARAHGASRSQTICKFVHLWVIFGEGLETLPWAVQTLSDAAIPDHDTRIEVLSLRARDALSSKEGAL